MNDTLDELFPGLLGFGAHVLPSADEARLLAALEPAGFAVRTLEGRDVQDEAGFFAAFARALGLPEEFGANWDALLDVLGELHDGPERRVALVWREAHVCLAKDLGTLLRAALACDRAAYAAEDDPDLEPLQLELFVLGEGPAFGSRP